MTDELSHVGPTGEARMVDVSAKAATERLARATGSIRMTPETLEAIRRSEIKKGDVLAVARIALGCQARTGHEHLTAAPFLP